ncbi:MAG: non-ribosomal peptide synthetase, partial [Chloroflexota bacterium]
MGLDNKLFHKVFEYNVEKFRNNIAVESAGNKTDYETLNRFANAIANLIEKENLAEAGGIVAILMSPGYEYIAAILGVMKAGRIFMPLSASAPPEVIKKNVQKAKPVLIIKDIDSQGKLAKLFESELSFANSIAIDRGRISVNGNEFNDYSNFDTANPAVAVLPDDSCYLIFTSGSTGEPKAILGRHKSLSHFVHWECREFAFDETTRIPLLAPVTFDVSFRDIFSPLLCGGRVLIPEPGVKNNYKLFAAWLDENKVTALHIVPSLLRILMKELGSADAPAMFKSMKYVLSAGEPLYGRDVEKWREIFGSRVELVNLYGPSETVLAKVFNRFGDARFDPNKIVPLGKPISNASVIILDGDKLCDIGVMGEIHIKTPFISNGYFNDRELNEKSFIVNPLTNDPADLVYKTGDMGKYLSDRQIEYIGRIDRQVKVYGNRVELGEIEYALNSIPEIDEAVIIPDKNHNFDVRLLAYYTLKSSLGRDEIRAKLSDSLPDYMLPSYFIELESFPLNFNGKINKKALPKPEDLLYESVAYVEPKTKTEKELAAIWSEALGINKIGIKNSYLEFGGNSLTAIKLISTIYKKFGAELNIRDLFENGSVES